MQQHQQQQQQRPEDNNVDEITNRLDRMNVDLGQQQQQTSDPYLLQHQQRQNVNAFQSQNVNNILNTSPMGQQQQNLFSADQRLHQHNLQMSIDDDDDEAEQHDGGRLAAADGNAGALEGAAANISRKKENMSNILIVTNLDSSVFNDKLVRTKFESLFTAYDANVTFRYLRSFRRVRLDFTDVQLAEAARAGLNNYKLGACRFRCYPAQIIRPNARLQQEAETGGYPQQQQQPFGNSFLSIPKPTKQFLISPPASPPVDWEPVNESSPCIDVRFISALANLVPGKVHEIHPASDSQPAIFVEVCEEAQFGGGGADSPMTTRCPRIPKTASPAAARAAATAPEQSDDCYQMQS